MKYRVENGEVKMPVSEINRLNDQAEALKERETVLDRREAEFYKMQRDETFVVIQERAADHWGFHGRFRWDEYKWIKEDSLIEKAVLSQLRNVERNAMIKKEAEFSQMSVSEFKKWKKEIT